MTDVEKAHIVSAAQFELSKCSEHVVHQNAINRFNTIDHDFAVQVASIFPHIQVPDAIKPNHGQKSAFLSMVDGKSQSEPFPSFKPWFGSHNLSVDTAVSAAGLT